MNFSPEGDNDCPSSEDEASFMQASRAERIDGEGKERNPTHHPSKIITRTGGDPGLLTRGKEEGGRRSPWPE